MPDGLILRAGARARRHLEEFGFRRDDFTSLIGASGGPKWLVLGAMDRVLHEHLLRDRQEPIHLLGSSIGAWRHACFAQADPLAALDRFEEAYTAQVYETKPTAAEVAVESAKVLRALFGDSGQREILANPLIRTHVATVRSRTLVASESRVPLLLGLGGAALVNAISRSGLAAFFERVIFHTGDPAFGFDGFATAHVPLREESLGPAILATGAVPMLIVGVRDIPGAAPGIYRDGGIVDYHFDFAFARPPGLALYPHFFERIIPGWFDKALTWRKPSVADLDDVVQIAPSAEFVASLPFARVPDRTDFQTMPTAQRLDVWRTVMDRAGALADELANLLATNRLAERVRPFPS